MITAEAVAALVDEVEAEAPPLTEEQATKIAALLAQPPRDDTDN